MKLIFNTSERTTEQFFGDLSKPNGWVFYGYNKQFQIDKDRTKPSGVKIVEWSKHAKLNPIRLILSAETPERKLQTAQNFAQLIENDAENIVRGYDAPIMMKNLERISKRITNHTTSQEARPITKAFERAIDALKEANLEYETTEYSRNNQGLKAADALSARDFYTKLGRTNWFTRFNKRIHIFQPSRDRFEIHLTSKPWFYHRFFGKAVPTSHKVAMVENLKHMIIAQGEFILASRFNTVGMLKNVNILEGKITRNADPVEKARIKADIKTVREELGKLGGLIAKERNNDFSNRLGRVVRDWIAKPIWTYAVKAPVKLSWNATAFTTKTLFKWTIVPTLKYGVQAPIKFGLNWTVVPAWNKIAKPVLTTTWDYTFGPVVTATIFTLTYPFSRRGTSS